jgi:hypothetical protein
MFISLGKDRKIALHEPHDFKRLHIETSDGMTRSEINAAMAPLATAGGDNFWLSVEALKALGPAGDAEWARNFDAMIASVKKFGWLSDDGARVRCHLKSKMSSTQEETDG